MTTTKAESVTVRRTGNALSELDLQEREAIVQFRHEHGRRWKQQLLQGWMRAAYPGLLQRIRNSYGPEWLVRVKDADFREVHAVKEGGSGVRGHEAPVCLSESDHNGEYGNKGHLTRRELVLMPVASLAHLTGARGEKREFNESDGKRYFGNYPETDWQAFKEAVNRDGMSEPITINIDLDAPITIYEGNHRLQAAIQSNWQVIAADIRYYGKAETMFRDNSFFRQETASASVNAAKDTQPSAPRPRMR